MGDTSGVSLDTVHIGPVQFTSLGLRSEMFPVSLLLSTICRHLRLVIALSVDRFYVFMRRRIGRTICAFSAGDDKVGQRLLTISGSDVNSTRWNY